MNYIELGNLYFESKKYKMFLNNTDYNKVFLVDNNDNKYVMPPLEDIKKLNNIYNKEIKYLFFIDDIVVKDNKKSKKIINDSCVFTLKHYNENFNYNTTSLIKKNSISCLEQKNKIDSNALLNALLSNPNFVIDEKRIFNKFKPFLDDMIDYINNEEVLNRLNTFNIKYEYKNNKKYDAPASANGLYDIDNNKIILFTVKKFSEIKNKEILFHEIIHLISKQGLIDKKRNIGNSLNEGMTQLLTREYFDGSLFVYDNNQTYVQIFCEILGADNILRCYLNNDIELLYKILLNYLNDKNEIIKLITTLDIIKTNEILLENCTNDLEDDITNENLIRNKESINKTLQEKYEYVFDAFKKLYTLKFKTDITCDKLMIAYFDSLFNTNILMCPLFKKDNIKQIAVEKGYYNLDYMVNHPGIRIVYQYINPIINEINLNKIPNDYKNEFRNSYINTMITSNTFVIPQKDRFNFKSLV